MAMGSGVQEGIEERIRKANVCGCLGAKLLHSTSDRAKTFPVFRGWRTKEALQERPRRASASGGIARGRWTDPVLTGEVKIILNRGDLFHERDQH